MSSVLIVGSLTNSLIYYFDLIPELSCFPKDYFMIFLKFNYYIFYNHCNIGLCTERNQVMSSIVLAGDPKQLYAIKKSTNAANFCFSISFMEYLSNQKCYMRDPNTDEYNPYYITLLTKNYRNHPSILAIANDFFYDGKLKAEAPTG